MAKLIYSVITSLDGYVADEHGKFDWAEPDEEVHRFVNELQRPIGTYLYGRRLYAVMAAWEFPSALEDQADYIRDFATIWRAAEKMVFSRTLKEPFTKRTRIVSQFDPAMVRSLKATSDRDISVGGPELAASAIQEGLVDEWQLFLSPVVIGGGASAYPHSRKSKLELLEQRRFKNGTTFLRYATRT